MLLLSFSEKIWGQNKHELSVAKKTSVENVYPKKIVYEGDTLVLITMDQVDSLNITYATVDEYKELSDSLSSSIDGYEVVIVKDKEIIKELEEKVDIKNAIIVEKDVIIEEHEKDNKKLKRKNKRLKFFNGVLMVTTTVLAVTTAILLL